MSLLKTKEKVFKELGGFGFTNQQITNALSDSSPLKFESNERFFLKVRSIKKDKDKEIFTRNLEKTKDFCHPHIINTVFSCTFGEWVVIVMEKGEKDCGKLLSESSKDNNNNSLPENVAKFIIASACLSPSYLFSIRSFYFAFYISLFFFFFVFVDHRFSNCGQSEGIASSPQRTWDPPS